MTAFGQQPGTYFFVLYVVVIVMIYFTVIHDGKYIMTAVRTIRKDMAAYCSVWMEYMVRQHAAQILKWALQYSEYIDTTLTPRIPYLNCMM